MSTGEVKRSLSLSKPTTSDSSWQSLATANPIFPRLLDASDLVKAESNPKTKLKPKRLAKKPPPKKRRRRRQPSTSEEEEEMEAEEEEECDGFTSHDSD